MIRDVAELVPHSPLQNRLLAALSPEVCARLLPHLEWVPLALGQVIYEPGQHLREVLFPTTCIVGRLQVLNNGSRIVLGLVGFDGVVGISAFMGGGSNINGAVVQSAGHGYRLDARALNYEFTHSPELLQILLRYTQAFLTQIAQTAVCTRLHSLDQQLCRWLLLCLDRAPSSALVLTQALVADMLGVRRESVTVIAGRLQAAGLIQYRRGKIVVLDRERLEARTCECYSLVRREYERLMPFLDLARPRVLAADSLSPAAC